VDGLKGQMSDRNEKMTDTSPLRRITQALADLKKEVTITPISYLTILILIVVGQSLRGELI
jgi:hypothetical protein